MDAVMIPSMRKVVKYTKRGYCALSARPSLSAVRCNRCSGELRHTTHDLFHALLDAHTHAILRDSSRTHSSLSEQEILASATQLDNNRRQKNHSVQVDQVRLRTSSALPAEMCMTCSSSRIRS